MNTGISDRELLERYRRTIAELECVLGSSVPVRGRMRRTITRYDGRVEEAVVDNIVVAAGLNHLATLGLDNTASAFAYLAIGTQTAQHSLGSVQGGIGEVARKIGATIATSKMTMIFVATWAGAADSLTSLDLRTGAIFNHASSGSGVMSPVVKLPSGKTGSVKSKLPQSTLITCVPVPSNTNANCLTVVISRSGKSEASNLYPRPTPLASCTSATLSFFSTVPPWPSSSKVVTSNSTSSI